jgi:hypothetical protein
LQYFFYDLPARWDLPGKQQDVDRVQSDMRAASLIIAFLLMVESSAETFHGVLV